LIAEVSMVEALIDRALEPDESYDHGAIHSFLILRRCFKSRSTYRNKIRVDSCAFVVEGTPTPDCLNQSLPKFYQ